MRNNILSASLPLDADNKDQLGLLRDVEGAILPGETGEADLLALSVTVLLDVLLSTLENDGALLLVGLLLCQQDWPRRIWNSTIVA